MKVYFKILAGILILCLISPTAFGQRKKAADSIFIIKQIKPKFSEMVDYGLPVNSGKFQGTSEGMAPASNLINADGSIKVSRIGEVTVPSETFKVHEIQKAKQPKSSNAKSKKRKN